MNTIDQAPSDVTCSEHVCHACEPHEWIRSNTAETIQSSGQHCCERICSHARAPHDRLRGDELARRERDPGSIDCGDFDPQPCFDAESCERLANNRACVSSDRGSHDRTMVNEDYPVFAGSKGGPELARH